MNINGMEKMIAHIRMSVIEDLRSFMLLNDKSEIDCSDSKIVVVTNFFNGSYSEYKLSKIVSNPCGKDIEVYYSDDDGVMHSSIRAFSVETTLDIAKWVIEDRGWDK